MIKIVFLIFIIIGTSFIGVDISKIYKNRTNFFFDFIGFCNNYEANLDFFQNNLDDFILSFCKLSSREFSIVISKKLNLNPINENVTLFPIEKKILNTEQEKYVDNFLSILGKSDTISQKKQIEAYKYYFTKEYDKAKATYETKGKTYGKLGFLFGIFICILLV